MTLTDHLRLTQTLIHTKKAHSDRHSHKKGNIKFPYKQKNTETQTQ